MLALITATRNSLDTLPQAIASTEGLRDKVKLFFVDGGSTDGSLEHLRKFCDREKNSVLILQNGSGLYQALNEGIEAALQDSNVTYIGMLHSDDQLLQAAYRRYLAFISSEDSDVYYSGIQFHDESMDRVRVWISGNFSQFKLKTGWMPPHTSVVVSKYVYQKYGLYNPEFGTAADYEWVVRVFSALGEKSRCFPEMTLSMSVGGASNSSLKARIRANAMDGKVWLKSSRVQSIIVRVCKPLRKISQFMFT